MPASSLNGLRGESDAIRIESQIELCEGVEIQRFRPTFREADLPGLGRENGRWLGCKKRCPRPAIRLQ